MTVRVEIRDHEPAVDLGGGLVMPPLVTVIDDDLEGYQVEIDVVPQEGRLVAREVRVRQRSGGPVVTTQALRAVPVAHLARRARDAALTRVTASRSSSWAVRAPVGESGEWRTHTGPTDAVLTELAEVYRRALAAGDPPKRAVVEALRVPTSTAGRWIALARDRGVLGPSEGRGRAGG